MNTTSLIGRITRDPDIRESQSGMKIARYSLAVDRRGDGTDFINCVEFDRGAEFVEKYFHKGMKIAVTGRIQTGSYTNRDGNKVNTFEVVVREHDFCERKQTEPIEEAPDDFMSIPEGIDEEAPFV